MTIEYYWINVFSKPYEYYGTVFTRADDKKNRNILHKKEDFVVGLDYILKEIFTWDLFHKRYKGIFGK